jgi:hypothetical protein
MPQARGAALAVSVSLALTAAPGAGCSATDGPAATPVATAGPPATTPAGPSPGPAAPSERGRAADPEADRAQAGRAVLTAGDLPGPGWAEADRTPVPGSAGEPDRCRPLDPDLGEALRRTEEAPAARSADLVTGDGRRTVEHDVAVLASEEQAAAALAAMGRPTFVECLYRIFVGESEQLAGAAPDPAGIVVEPLTEQSPEGADGADVAAGTEPDTVALHVTLPAGAGPTHVLVSVSRVGRLLSTFTLVGQGAVDPAEYGQLRALALARVRRAAA